VTTPGRERRLIVFAVVTLAVGGLALWLLYLLRGVLLVLYISTLLAIGFSPAVLWIERRAFGRRKRHLPRWAAVLVLYLGLLATAALVLAVVLPPFAAQATELWQALPGYVDQLQRKLVGWKLIAHRWTWSDLLKNIESPSLALAGVMGAVQGVIGAVGTVLTILLLPYYMLVEAETLQQGWLQLLAPDRRPRAARVTANVALKVGAWLNGQILLSLIIGATASLGLWLLGVPYFYVLGLIAGIGEAVPVVGPIVAAVPAILMGATVSVNTAIFVAAYFSLQQFLENNLLVPRIMQRQVGLSAVAVIVSLLVGTELLGVMGALLAVPTAAIVQVLVREFLQRD
jgi:predicted PurR-regulated permease PerM